MATSTLRRPEEVASGTNNQSDDRSSGTGDVPTAVTIISSFTVFPSREAQWQETWEELAQLALRRPECRGFRILPGNATDGRFSVISTWACADDYYRFVREASLVWLDRIMPGLLLPAELSIVEEATTTARD